MRIWVRSPLSFEGQRGGAVYEPGEAKPWIDVTDRPCRTITQQPVTVRITDEDDPAMHIGGTSVDKPPYRVPTMDEVRAVPWNGYTVASTFSGGGGSSCGYRMAGFRVTYANEFVPAARDTYRANASPDTHVDGRDIREVTPESVLERARVGYGELDLLDGSPPCASFSTAGQRHKKWGQQSVYSSTVQRTDDLFFEFVRLVKGIAPRTFVAENVSGLVKGVAKGYYIQIARELAACGYVVRSAVLDAQWLGVPQARQRLIFIGVREDLAKAHGVGPVFPTPLPYRYTVRDALPWLRKQARGSSSFGPDSGAMYATDQPSPTLGASEKTGNGYWPASRVEEDPRARVIHQTEGSFSASGDVTDRPMPAILASGQGGASSRRAYRVVHDTQGYGASGGDITDRPSPTVKSAAGGGDDRAWRVVHDTSGQFGAGDVTDRPSPAVTVGVHAVNQLHFRAEDAGVLVRDPETGAELRIGGKTVPKGSNQRKLTLGELRALCGFPEDYALTGSYSERWERCGRAVPPVMMAHIAATVRDEVLAKLKEPPVA